MLGFLREYFSQVIKVKGRPVFENIFAVMKAAILEHYKASDMLNLMSQMFLNIK